MTDAAPAPARSPVAFPRLGPRRWPLPPADVRPTLLDGYAHGIYRHAAVLAGMELDVFSPLASGPRTAAQLAADLELDPHRLRPLLDALVVTGLLVRDGDGYANTGEADRFLVQGREGCLADGHVLYRELWAAALLTAWSIRDGRPHAAQELSGLPPADAMALLRGRHPGALRAGRHLARALRLEACDRMLHIGGGSAGLAIAACRRCPNLRATVLAPPPIVPLTQTLIDESGMVDRVRLHAGDLVAGLPDVGPFDVAIVHDVIQELPPAKLRHALSHLRAALHAGGWLHIVDWVRDDDAIGPANAVLHEMLLLNTAEHGHVHRAADLRVQLSEAGFADVTLDRAPEGASGPGASLVSARRP